MSSPIFNMESHRYNLLLIKLTIFQDKKECFVHFVKMQLNLKIKYHPLKKNYVVVPLTP